MTPQTNTEVFRQMVPRHQRRAVIALLRGGVPLPVAVISVAAASVIATATRTNPAQIP